MRKVTHVVARKTNRLLSTVEKMQTEYADASSCGGGDGGGARLDFWSNLPTSTTLNDCIGSREGIRE